MLIETSHIIHGPYLGSVYNFTTGKRSHTKLMLYYIPCLKACHYANPIAVRNLALIIVGIFRTFTISTLIAGSRSTGGQ